MQREINLNADMRESFGNYKIGDAAELMKVIRTECAEVMLCANDFPETAPYSHLLRNALIFASANELPTLQAHRVPNSKGVRKTKTLSKG